MSVSLPKFEKFLGVISLNNLPVHFSLSSPSGSPIIHRLFLLMISYSSCRLSSLIFIPFNLFSFHWVVSSGLSSSSRFLSSVCSSLLLLLLLLLSVEFFISFLIFFSFRICGVFFMIFISVIAFLVIISHVVFLILWNYFSVFSCSSWRFLKMTIFSSLLGKLNYRSPFLWGWLLENCCIPLVVSCFLVCCCCCCFIFLEVSHCYLHI